MPFGWAGMDEQTGMKAQMTQSRWWRIGMPLMIGQFVAYLDRTNLSVCFGVEKGLFRTFDAGLIVELMLRRGGRAEDRALRGHTSAA